MEAFQIPQSLYMVIGVIVIANLGTIGTLIVFIFKCGKFVSDTNHGIKDAKDCGVRAHSRIDQITKGA